MPQLYQDKTRKFLYKLVSFLTVTVVFVFTSHKSSVLAQSPPAPASAKKQSEAAPLQSSGGFPYIRQTDPKLLRQGEIVRVLSFQNQSIRNVISIFKQKTQLNIVASDKVKGNFSAYLSNVPSRDALRNILAVNNLYFIEDATHNLIRIVTRAEYIAYAAQNLVKTQAFQINMGDVKVIARSIQPVLTAGISRLLIDERTNRLMISDLPHKLEEVEMIIREFTKPPRQIVIETKIVEIQLDKQNQFGIDWSALDIPNVVKSVQTTFIPRDANNSSKAANPGLAIMKTEKTSDGATVEAFLHALGKDLHIDTVSSPKILVEHNKKAKIHVGRQIPYNETVTQGLTSNQSSSFKFLDTGSKLIITPQITSTGEIYMDISIEVSSSPEFVEFGPNGSVGKAPLKDSTNMDTTVVVKDKDLIILGGLIRKIKSKEKRGIPILMDIPLLGYFFSYTDIQDQIKETVIFLSPRIDNEYDTKEKQFSKKPKMRELERKGQP